VSEAEKMWDALRCLPEAVEHLIHGDPDGANSVKASDAVEWAISEIARLREERRWVPVGDRLPQTEEWVDVAGLWGDSLGWHDGEEWRNVQEDPFPSEVTHWRKRGPGPDGVA